MRRPALFLTLAPALLLLTACDRPEPGVPADFPEPDALPAVQAAVSTETPELGEVVDVDIRVTADQRLVLPPVEEWLDPNLRVLRRERSDIRTENRWTRTYDLSVGLYAITNITLFAEAEIQTLSEPALDLELPFLSLSVEERIEDAEAVPKLGTTELPDFRGPEALKRRRRNLLMSAAVLGIVVLIALWVAYRWSKRPKPPPPPIARDQLALRQMADLEQRDIWARPDADACAVELSRILRRYIEGRFDIHAPERTTEEFLHEVAEDRPWSDEAQEGLAGFFDQTDRIKFAGERPEREVLEDLMAEARRFVRATAKTPRPEAGE